VGRGRPVGRPVPALALRVFRGDVGARVRRSGVRSHVARHGEDRLGGRGPVARRPARPESRARLALPVGGGLRRGVDPRPREGRQARGRRRRAARGEGPARGDPPPRPLRPEGGPRRPGRGLRRPRGLRRRPRQAPLFSGSHRLRPPRRRGRRGADGDGPLRPREGVRRAFHDSSRPLVRGERAQRPRARPPGAGRAEARGGLYPRRPARPGPALRGARRDSRGVPQPPRRGRFGHRSRAARRPRLPRPPRARRRLPPDRLGNAERRALPVGGARRRDTRLRHGRPLLPPHGPRPRRGARRAGGATPSREDPSLRAPARRRAGAAQPDPPGPPGPPRGGHGTARRAREGRRGSWTPRPDRRRLPRDPGRGASRGAPGNAADEGAAREGARALDGASRSPRPGRERAGPGSRGGRSARLRRGRVAGTGRR
jgi:hypothetical protein